MEMTMCWGGVPEAACGVIHHPNDALPGQLELTA